MKAVTVILILLLLTSPLGYVNVVQSTILPSSIVMPQPDGNEWRELLDNDKLVYIAGYIRGYQDASGDVWDEMKERYPEYLGMTESLWEAMVTSYDTLSLFPLGKEFKYEMYKDGLDAFYEDYANRIIFFCYAIRIVAARIRGIPQYEIIRATEEARTHSIEGLAKWKKTKKGQK